jgi:hypothetical protein
VVEVSPDGFVSVQDHDAAGNQSFDGVIFRAAG